MKDSAEKFCIAEKRKRCCISEKGVASLELMFCTIFFMLAVSVALSIVFHLGSLLKNNNMKSLAYSHAMRCATIADALASNPEGKTSAKVECAVFENLMGSDFNEGFVYAKSFANAKIVGKPQGLEVVVDGSHYR